jgi:hypothetical protein
MLLNEAHVSTSAPLNKAQIICWKRMHPANTFFDFSLLVLDFGESFCFRVDDTQNDPRVPHSFELLD